MFGVKRSPGQTPRPLPAPAPVVPVSRVQLTGRLVGIEGSDILELIHLDVTGTEQREQQILATGLINEQVNVTVELVDVAAALHEMAASQGGEYDPISGTMLMEGEAV